MAGVDLPSLNRWERDVLHCLRWRVSVTPTEWHAWRTLLVHVQYFLLTLAYTHSSSTSPERPLTSTRYKTVCTDLPLSVQDAVVVQQPLHLIERTHEPERCPAGVPLGCMSYYYYIPQSLAILQSS